MSVGQTFSKEVKDDVPTDDYHLFVDDDVEIDSDAEYFEAGYLSFDMEEDDD